MRDEWGKVVRLRKHSPPHLLQIMPQEGRELWFLGGCYEGWVIRTLCVLDTRLTWCQIVELKKVDNEKPEAKEEGKEETESPSETSQAST